MVKTACIVPVLYRGRTKHVVYLHYLYLLLLPRPQHKRRRRGLRRYARRKKAAHSRGAPLCVDMRCSGPLNFTPKGRTAKLVNKTWFSRPVDSITPCPGPIHLYMNISSCAPLDWGEVANRLRRDTLPYSALPCNETLRLTVPAHEAARVVASMSVAFGFLIRDGDAYLERNLPLLDTLGSAFARFWILFEENDSTDTKTRTILKKLLRRPNVYGELLNGVSPNASASMCTETRNCWPTCRNCMPRIKLLADMRQRLILRALRLPALDVFVMVDLDYVYFSPPDFLQMAFVGRQVKASAIMGQSMFRNARNDCGMYDRTAVVPAEALDAIKLNCFGAVDSAFSGFSVMYMDAVRAALSDGGLKPDYIKGLDDLKSYKLPGYQLMKPRTRSSHRSALYRSKNTVKNTVHSSQPHAEWREVWLNEHVAFNLALSRWGRAHGRPMVIDPRFRPIYNWGESTGILPPSPPSPPSPPTSGLRTSSARRTLPQSKGGHADWTAHRTKKQPNTNKATTPQPTNTFLVGAAARMAAARAMAQAVTAARPSAVAARASAARAAAARAAVASAEAPRAEAAQDPGSSPAG